MVAFWFPSNSADEEAGAKAVTWDLFDSESSFNVIPQLSELHGPDKGCGKWTDVEVKVIGRDVGFQILE